jgi:septation ring formation regulator EzrA
MIYVKIPNNDWDLSDFDYFKNMRELEKAIQRNIQQYGSELSHIDFKWSEVEDDFDQFTIYKA